MAKNDETLADILKRAKKDFGAKVMTVGVDDLTSYGTLSLGSPGLDFCLYNSLPEARIIEYCGGEGSGKTTASYLTAASFQKKEIKRNPDNPRKILFVDLECTIDPYWSMKACGYDMNSHPVETICFRPEDLSAEQIFDYIIALVKTGEIGLVIIDSLNMLVGQQTHNKSMEDKDMGGIAKVLGDFVKRITSILIKYQCTLIGINQLREKIGGYGNPLTTSGGRGWKHGCSVRLMFKKGAFYDEDGEELKSTAESPAGYIMEVAVLKTKVCKWDRKLGRTRLSYDRGIDILQDTIDIATIFGYIDNSVQGSFKLIDPDTGEMLLDENGNEIKIRGKRNLKPYFEEHLDQWRKLYDKVYEKLEQKEDPNIVAFEKMLNVDIASSFNVDLNLESE